MCTSSDSKLQEQIEQSALPRAIAKHLVTCLKQGIPSRAIAALRVDFPGVIQDTLAVSTAAGKTVGLDADTLIRNTGFDANDLDAKNFDGTIAILRGINHLAREGFSPVCLLKPQKGVRTADLVATRNGAKIAIEIACSVFGAVRDVESLRDYMWQISQDKASQLENTVKAEKCSARALLFVINSEPAIIWGHQETFLEVAKRVHADLGAQPAYYIAILTGKIAQVLENEEYFEGSDDVVYPPWP